MIPLQIIDTSALLKRIRQEQTPANRALDLLQGREVLR